MTGRDWPNGQTDESAAMRQPAFNAPSVVLWTIAVLVAAHLLRLLLPYSAEIQVIYSFSFIPARLTGLASTLDRVPFLLGDLGLWLSFVTYALLHANFVHLIFNGIWLLAFGTPVARRLGETRFLILFVLCAIAGALAHLAVNPAGDIPVIGASGAISGLMGAAARFIFTQARAAALGWPQGIATPLSPLTDGRVLSFVAVWTGINLLFGVTGMQVMGEAQLIAWEAHLGGFFAGLLLMPLVDPHRPPDGMLDTPPRP